MTKEDEDESLGLLGKLIDRKIEQRVEEIVPSMVQAQLRALYNRPIGDLFAITPQEVGRNGGLARAKNLEAEALSAIGRKGAEARWGKKKESAETESNPTDGSGLYLSKAKRGSDAETLAKVEIRFLHCAEILAKKERWTSVDLLAAITKKYSQGEWFKTRLLFLERGFMLQEGMKSRAKYDVTDRCHAYLKIASEEAIQDGIRALTGDGCLSISERIQKIQVILAKAGPRGLRANDLADQLGGDRQSADNAIRRAFEEKAIEEIGYSRAGGRLLVLKGSKKAAPKPAEPEPPVPEPIVEVKPEPPPPKSTRWLKDKVDRQVQKVIVALGEYPSGLEHEELAKEMGVPSPMLLQIQSLLLMRKICTIEGKAIKAHYRLNSTAAGKWLVDRFRDEDGPVPPVNGAIHA